MNSVINEPRYHQLTDREIEEYLSQLTILKQELNHQLDEFCRSLNIEANLTRVSEEFEQACRARCQQPITITLHESHSHINIKIALTNQLKRELNLAITQFLTHLAKDLVDDAMTQPHNSLIFRGSLSSVCRKMIFYYTRPDVSLKDIEHFNIENTFSSNMAELSFDNLLAHTIDYYREHFHRYKLWDTRAIQLFALFLFESREYFTPPNSSHNLHYLVESKNPISKQRFKELCINYWNHYCDDPLVARYTEQAFPNQSGVIFAEYIPLEHVSEAVWFTLYQCYQDRSHIAEIPCD
ncbi:hypothetical protein BIY21_03020 [Vibrio ponticus]|uniref:Uncharacterized protein n=1 Tax=Vibrio ponticus TaxID=265668 RepID=A0ABX3FCG1_9VIBR|nr:hypothetical protein [Vibrio ponticus]OLQ89091.1 hypothetical protein BIY21_03020 [Vibrio ponticus]